MRAFAPPNLSARLSSLDGSHPSTGTMFQQSHQMVELE